MKVELIAKRAGRYGKKVAVGERFTLNRTEARVLVAVGLAEYAPKEPAKPAPKVYLPKMPAPVPKTAAPAPSPRTYLRRDMKAEE